MIQRRLDEGEGVGRRAIAGRGKALGGSYGEDGGKAKPSDIDCDSDTDALRHDGLSLCDRLHSNFTHASIRCTTGAATF